MRGKLVLLVGVGIGYVLGARAGRERYEDIKGWARNLWNDPRVQHQVHEAGEFAKDKAPDVARALADGTKKVVSRAKRNQSAADRATERHECRRQRSQVHDAEFRLGRHGRPEKRHRPGQRHRPSDGFGAAHADAPQAHD